MAAATPSAPGSPAVAPPARGWQRWLPQSLFGRLMAVLVAGLLLAQGLSAVINVAERDQLLARGFGQQPLQRIADVVRLLDGLTPAGRAQVVAVFRLPPLVLSLPDPAAGAPAEAPLPVPPDADAGRGALLAERLRNLLGDERAVVLTVRPLANSLRRLDGPGSGAISGAFNGHAGMMDRPGPHPMGPAYGPGSGARGEMGRHGMPPPLVLHAEVQLRDGAWAVFDTDLPKTADALPWRLLATLAVLLLSVLGLSWWAVRRVVQPLHQLAQAAQGLGQDIHRPPLAEDGPREVRQAAQAFNTMQRRLASTIDERTRMLTALSHDLKTPLTRMRLRTELLDDDEARQRFEADLHEMEAMVSQTLDFLRGLGGHEPRAPVDIDALLASLQSDNEAMGRTLAIEGSAAGPFTGVPSLLRRALGNLVDNAVLYGGSATVRVDDGPRHLVLEVRDNGPGIPEAELERVFEPFHRLEGSRSRATGGTGLGLGIVRSIARLHGGEVTLHNRPEGGLAARLSLPRGAPGA